MSSSLETQLYLAATLTFEELAFLCPTAVGDDPRPDASAAHVVSVRFRGRLRGRLELAIAPQLLPNIAMNMLGLDAPPPVQVQRDALGEIANVICGNVLPAVAGATTVLDLAAPETVEATSGRESSQLPAAEARFGLEEGWASVKLFVNQKPQQ